MIVDSWKIRRTISTHRAAQSTLIREPRHHGSFAATLREGRLARGAVKA
jgi:hypothetical protein